MNFNLVLDIRLEWKQYNTIHPIGHTCRRVSGVVKLSCPSWLQGKAFWRGAYFMVPILQPTVFFLDMQAIMYMAALAIITLA